MSQWSYIFYCVANKISMQLIFLQLLINDCAKCNGHLYTFWIESLQEPEHLQCFLSLTRTFSIDITAFVPCGLVIYEKSDVKSQNFFCLLFRLIIRVLDLPQIQRHKHTGRKTSTAATLARPRDCLTQLWTINLSLMFFRPCIIV